MSEHTKDCRWERTISAECVYRDTHHYCPHPEHACDCRKPKGEDYVAWLRFKRHEGRGSALHLCNSDDEGAFKVYRHPEAELDRLKSINRELVGAMSSLKAEKERLWDLARYQRGELLNEGLITKSEYADLAKDHPTVKRLETYDAMRAEIERLRKSEQELRAALNEANRGHNCRVCGVHWSEGHAPDCIVGAALDAARKVKGEHDANPKA